MSTGSIIFACFGLVVCLVFLGVEIYQIVVKKKKEKKEKDTNSTDDDAIDWQRQTED